VCSTLSVDWKRRVLRISVTRMVVSRESAVEPARMGRAVDTILQTDGRSSHFDAGHAISMYFVFTACTGCIVTVTSLAFVGGRCDWFQQLR
jgi:hypothetical protein